MTFFSLSKPLAKQKTALPFPVLTTLPSLLYVALLYAYMHNNATIFLFSFGEAIP
mgnify:CR=1 FL=1